MKKYINDYGKECYSGVVESDKFSSDLFHMPEYQFEDDQSFALHTNLGSITVLDRMTGYGFRDVESGFRDPDGNFWLASGKFDIRYEQANTIGEAINLIKKEANTCVPELEKEG